MKRKREIERKSEIMKSAIEELSLLIKFVIISSNNSNTENFKGSSPSSSINASAFQNNINVETLKGSSPSSALPNNNNIENLKGNNPVSTSSVSALPNNNNTENLKASNPTFTSSVSALLNNDIEDFKGSTPSSTTSGMALLNNNNNNNTENLKESSPSSTTSDSALLNNNNNADIIKGSSPSSTSVFSHPTTTTNSNSKDDNQIEVIKGSPSSTTGVSALTTNNDNTNDNHFRQQNVVYDVATRPFISLCSSILHVLDKIGPTMAVLRQDIFKNIQRIEMLYDTNPTKYSYLDEILKKEAVDKTSKKGDSSSKALVWLIRSLDFTSALLQRLIIDPSESMEQIVGDAYDITFKPWHGWVSATAFRVALKLLPDTATFIDVLKAEDESIETFTIEIQAFLSLLVPLLQHLHSTLRIYGLEKIKST